MPGDDLKSHYPHHGSSRHFSRHEIKSAKREEQVGWLPAVTWAGATSI